MSEKDEDKKELIEFYKTADRVAFYGTCKDKKSALEEFKHFLDQRGTELDDFSEFHCRFVKAGQPVTKCNGLISVAVGGGDKPAFHGFGTKKG